MRIVVGVDRSEGARAALRFALDEAVVHDVELVAVHAWQAGFESAFPDDVVTTLRVAALEQAALLVETVLEQAQAERPRRAERAIARPVQGEPAAVLLSQVQDDDHLVVGANEGGLVRRLVLGSVCAQVLHTARCPVTVVPPPHG